MKEKGLTIDMNMWPDKKLGFGLMRLPQKGNQIDFETTCALVDAFLAKGFSYFDTAYAYAGSEEMFREAVVKRHPRESFSIASKMASWRLTQTFTPDDMLNEQLARCGVDYFDYYLLHALQPSRLGMFADCNAWSFLAEKKREGKIRKCGFSFHGSPELLEELLDEHPDIDFVQLQINYIDWEDSVICCHRNYDICRKHQKDIVVMEPAKGGFLANLKPQWTEAFQKLDPTASAASYAFRFVGSLPGIRVILSGMNALDQVYDNMNTFDHFVPLSEQERAAIEVVKLKIRQADVVPCTACRYCCDGCPQQINIAEIFKAYNMFLTFGEHLRPYRYYDDIKMQGSGTAASCIKCGQCELACPQHISIIEKLEKASERLDK